VLETNNNKYPKEPWFQAYTNGSNMADCVNTGAGVFSDLISFPSMHLFDTSEAI
jgi:hypothetical protein